ncbi:hypothetical protein BGZ94_000763 [Podila epigama]|nr:hypothetical protein BGZ94_000763 [Podila epigama]
MSSAHGVPAIENGDHILLLPPTQPPSQNSTPSFATVPSFVNNSGSSVNISAATSGSLSHKGATVHSSSSSPAPETRDTLHRTNGNSGRSSSIDVVGSSETSIRSSEPSRHHSQPSTAFQKYISNPLRAFLGYLSSSDRVHSHPNVKIPPWLFPQYRGRKPFLRSAILRPLCRLFLLIIILAVLIASTILYSFRNGQPLLSDYGAVQDFDWPPIKPRSYLSPMNSSFGVAYDVLLDGHSHTTYSDGRMSPETLIKWHIDYAITKWPTDEQLRQTIKRTHELGGLAIINHIPWSNTTEYGYQLPRMQNHQSREALVEMGIDGFEIVNGATLDTISLKFIQDNNLILMAGTDVHYPDSATYGWTILNTNNNRSQESIMAQLRARKTSFLFDPTGTQPIAYPPESTAFYRTAPPTLLGQYFQMFWSDQTGMYSFSPQGGFCHEEILTIRWKLIGYFIAWVLVGFLLFEAARLIIVGCIWGPYQRRRKYLRKRQALEREENEDDIT